MPLQWVESFWQGQDVSGITKRWKRSSYWRTTGDKFPHKYIIYVDSARKDKKEVVVCVWEQERWTTRSTQNILHSSVCVCVCQIASFNRRFYGNCEENASPEVKGQLRLIHFCWEKSIIFPSSTSRPTSMLSLERECWYSNIHQWLISLAAVFCCFNKIQQHYPQALSRLTFASVRISQISLKYVHNTMLLS